MVAPRLEGYRWMGGGAAPGRSGYGRGGAGFFVREGYKGNIGERKEWRTPNSTWVELAGQGCIFIIGIVYLPPGGTVDNFKVTLAAIEKRILAVVKEGRPLIIGGDWNARVGKGWNGRGESTYNTRGKYLHGELESRHCGLCGSMEMDGQSSWWLEMASLDRSSTTGLVKLKDPADNCGGVWMERWKWKSYSEEDRKSRWREYKRGCKRFFKGEEWKAMVKKTREGTATVEDLWRKWKKGLWDCAMRWFGRERTGRSNKAGQLCGSMEVDGQGS
ncbi:hypothetical protein QOT17_025383 [Balamuthia mandrillaris]